MVIVRLLVLLLSVYGLWAVDIPATVKHVTDGDTIVVTSSDGAEVKDRLLFLDTPESKDNAHGASIPEGKAAAAFLWDLLPVGEAVTLWGPGTAFEHDRYGRKLLAREVQIGQPIKARWFKPVAEILAAVYRLRKGAA